MKVKKSNELFLVLLVGASLFGCRHNSSAEYAKISSSSNEAVVLTDSWTQIPSLEALAAHGGLFTGYYRASCKKYKDADRTDSGKPIVNFYLPGVSPKDRVGRKLANLQKAFDADALFTVVQDKDKLSIKSWKDSGNELRNWNITYFYSVAKNEDGAPLEYVDKGEVLNFTAKMPINPSMMSNINESQKKPLDPYETANVVMKKTPFGFRLDIDMYYSRISEPDVDLGESTTIVFVKGYQTCEFRKVNETPAKL